MTNVVVKGDEIAELWHKRLAHLNFQGIQVLHDQSMVIGLPSMKKMQHCEGCMFGKLTRLPFQVGRFWRAKQKVHLVHVDVCGHMQRV